MIITLTVWIDLFSSASMRHVGEMPEDLCRQITTVLNFQSVDEIGKSYLINTRGIINQKFGEI